MAIISGTRLLVRAEGMRAHEHVRGDTPCELGRHRRAALGTARIEGGSGVGGGGGGGAKDGEIGDPFESDDRSHLMNEAIRGPSACNEWWHSLAIRDHQAPDCVIIRLLIA